MIREEELIQLGFNRTDVSEEESGDKAFYYYTYDIGIGVISLITQGNDEVENNNWYIEVYEDANIRFTTIEDLTKFIQVTEKNIITSSKDKQTGPCSAHAIESDNRIQDEEALEERMKIIGQNGNTGEHYK